MRIRQGVVDRLRTLVLAFDRQDRLETAQAFVGWLEDERTAEGLLGDAREMLLRALKVASDPVNFRLLSALDPIEPVDVPTLMSRSNLGRVAVSERVNDLVQTGLAVRELVNDQVRGTELSAGFAAWVEAIASGAGTALADELGRRAENLERPRR
ncbi:MAG: hypothetical protein OEM62_02615 [Acidobacteriota bacterium]|nr:hypothetical protein [Acidobacteriota bacterium]